MLTYLTAGESHGKALIAIIEGLPARLKIDVFFINRELARRQLGFGRGGRMQIEKDEAQLMSGIRDGLTIGSPISLIIKNKDWRQKLESFFVPRPGHADLSGVLKSGIKDIRNILERSSARQTAPLVGIGAFAKILLKEFGVSIVSHVTAIGSVKAKVIKIDDSMSDAIDSSPVRTVDKEAEAKMVEATKEAQKNGNTLGGSFEVVATGLVAGLGSYSVPEKRLDGRLCKALVSIPAIKAAAVGDIMQTAFLPGSQAHDEIFHDPGKGYFRKTNKAGGIEGGISNGNDIVLSGYMKPIPTLSTPLESVDINTKKPAKAFNERHDTVAVPAAAVIAEASVALELADAYLEKFGSDNLEDIKVNYQNYLKRIKLM